MAKPSILVVDDEPMVLSVVERVLRLSMACEITKALSGIEALKLLEKRKFDIVISDMAMPGMDGAEFLKTVHELHPGTMRLVLSARSGGEAVMRAVGVSHQYFMKPSSVAVISDRLNSMLQFRDLLPDEGVYNVISGIETLPSIPAVYAELDAELKKGDVGVDAVGRILEKDISMSAKVLQLVNSAFFGLREKVTKPSQGVMLLGINTIKALFLGIHVFEQWEGRRVAGFSPEQLWSHSMSVAAGAMKIATSMGMVKEGIGEVYCAGLFHDIGKLIIASNLPDSLEQIQKLVAQGMRHVEAERNILGSSHSEIGGYLLALWGFPMAITKATSFHHCPVRGNESGFSPLLAVHVANSIYNEAVQVPGMEPLDMDYIKAQGFDGHLVEWRKALI